MKTPDTIDTSEQELNAWQRVSNATNNVVAPANVMTAGGVVGAKYGLDHIETRIGLAATCVSFMMDFADGKVARATGTESELGEKLDAVSDKIKLGYALIKIWQKDLAPKDLLCAVAVQNSYNAAITLADQKLNKEEPVIHASKSGKRAIFLQQWGLGLHVLSTRLEKTKPTIGRSLRTSANVLGTCGVGLGVVASTGYTKELIRSQKKKV